MMDVKIKGVFFIFFMDVMCEPQRRLKFAKHRLTGSAVTVPNIRLLILKKY